MLPFSAFHAAWRPYGLVCGFLLLAAPCSAQPSQVQVARQFLALLLRGDYQPAYRLLAPEVSAHVTLARFTAAAQPLHAQSLHYGRPIALYRLGLRLGAGNTVRNFYSFTFNADTLAARPHTQLDVTFRDSTATRVLSFGLIPAPQGNKK